MSQFSNQLQASAEKIGITQTAICDRTEISQGQLSRYMSGENRPPPDAFAKLATIFPEEDQIALLQAFLADEIPDSLKNLLSIAPRRGSARVQEEPAVYRTRMPRELREAYDFIGNDALKNADTADWLIANYRRLKPRKD